MNSNKADAVQDCLNDFIAEWDEEESRRVWQDQSRIFRDFWRSHILNDSNTDLAEDDMIPVIQILDARGKSLEGSEKRYEGAAYTGIYQSVWYKTLRTLKKELRIKGLVNDVLTAATDDRQVRLLNQLYDENQTVPALTGESAVVIDDFLFTFEPEKNLSALSLADRFRIIEFFKEGGESSKYIGMKWGEQIIKSRNELFSINSILDTTLSGRGLSSFFYGDCLKRLWKQEVVEAPGQPATGKKQLKLLKEIPSHAHAHVVGELINFRGMDYAPAEENGVIFLFSKITEDLGFKVRSIQKSFPDAECIQYDEQTAKGYIVYIEFEHSSSGFQAHLNDLKNGKRCDYVVCWDHDWKECERYVKVICLKDLIKTLPSS